MLPTPTWNPLKPLAYCLLPTAGFWWAVCHFIF